MWSEKDREITRKALLYELRLLIKGSDKEQYMFDLLDTIAAAKS